MKIVVFGAGGQVGAETVALGETLHDDSVIALRRVDADLSIPGAARAAIRRLRPHGVINAAAWTAVDQAESERAAAGRINGEAAGEIAAACNEAGAKLVHISTDYVFAGDDNRAPLTEEAPVGPLNAYGVSKLEGEMRVAKHHPSAVILRTSWVYSVHGANFVKTMLRLAQSRTEVDVVEDQRGGPTPAAAVAHAALTILSKPEGPGGVYHFQGSPPATWAEFAGWIFESAGRKIKINPIPTCRYPSPACRPLFTVLDCSKIRRDFGLQQPDWRADIARLVDFLDKQDASTA